MPKQFDLLRTGEGILHHTEGVDAIGGALRELESAGYIVRHQMWDRQGRISDTEIRHGMKLLPLCFMLIVTMCLPTRRFIVLSFRCRSLRAGRWNRQHPRLQSLWSMF